MIAVGHVVLSADGARVLRGGVELAHVRGGSVEALCAELKRLFGAAAKIRGTYPRCVVEVPSSESGGVM